MSPSIEMIRASRGQVLRRSRARGAILASTSALLVLLAGQASALDGQGLAPAEAPPAAVAARAVLSPKEAFGHEVGADYSLVNYTKFEAWLKTVATQSDRIRLFENGTSTEGRTMYVAAVSSPANLARIDHYQSIARRLARAEGVSETEARALAAEGKTIVWIDGGLHATETVPPQALIAAIHEYLTADDPEVRRILDDVIILFAPLNPDGWELVSDWYMRNDDPLKREFSSLPRLYQAYVGHDNNRDYYMSAMRETTNVNRALFRQWYPQIMYNHHQTAPAGTVVFMPPFRDPFNHNYDPLIMTTLSEVGANMHSRLVGEGKAGSTMRSSAPYSTWNNGMQRSVTYFHNMVGLLTEITGHPTPSRIALVPANQSARNDLPMPIAPQEWRFAQSIDYSLSINRSVLDYASRNRDRLLFNSWRMGANSIERGQTDTWKVTPSQVDALVEKAQEGRATSSSRAATQAVDADLYESVLRDPAKRDPRGYVIPADQADLPNAVTFVNSLIRTGVDVERATRAFSVGGKTYPAGSFVVKTAQAYRPHVLDMFEPQDHPHDLQYPGGPPVLPYDATGYTLALQMGIEFDRVLEGFDGPFERLTDEASVTPGRVHGQGGAGWLVDHASLNSFILTNRLLAAGVPVSWQSEQARAGGHDFKPGAIWIPASANAEAILRKATTELGLDAYAARARPSGESIALKPIRIGLVDRYGGAMSSGWTRWLMEQFEFPFEVVYPQQLDAGELNSAFDVLVFASDVLPGDLAASAQRGQPKPADIPAEYHAQLGYITAERTAPQIDAFARNGGVVITIGGAHRLAGLISPEVVNVLRDEKGEALAPTDFFIPGALLKVGVDNRRPLAFGAPDSMDVFFNRSAGFKPVSSSSVMRYPATLDVSSGWAIGPDRLAGSEAVLDLPHGQGRLIVLGPDVVQRAQARASLKLLFNGLLYGPAARQ